MHNFVDLFIYMYVILILMSTPWINKVTLPYLTLVTHINLCLANYHLNIYLANTHPYSLLQTLTHTFYLANSRLYIGAGELSPIYLTWRTLTHIFDRANSHPYIFIWRTHLYLKNPCPYI